MAESEFFFLDKDTFSFLCIILEDFQRIQFLVLVLDDPSHEAVSFSFSSLKCLIILYQS